ncbi:MAG TPA: hypothetical protein DD979_04510 [Gammaproteobacteria bacterium]|nr:hypothetical protein [Gammaproteobacteria bacterium]
MGTTGKSHSVAQRCRQRGIGLIGAMVVIAIIAAAAIFAMSAAPMYFNHMTVMDIAKDVSQEPGLRDKSVRQIKQSVAQRFQTNSLWDLDPAEVISVRRDRELGLIVDVDYEVRRPLIYNMELVARFHETNIGLN